MDLTCGYNCLKFYLPFNGEVSFYTVLVLVLNEDFFRRRNKLVSFQGLSPKATESQSVLDISWQIVLLSQNLVFFRHTCFHGFGRVFLLLFILQKMFCRWLKPHQVFAQADGLRCLFCQRLHLSLYFCHMTTRIKAFSVAVTFNHVHQAHTDSSISSLHFLRLQ